MSIDSEKLFGFLREQRLPGPYLQQCRDWFLPLASELACQQRRVRRPLLVGIHGCQGSGKSTLAALLRLLLAEAEGLRAINLSLDDFYLTLEERQRLARRLHPLLATRGVPGTHDLALLRETLRSLRAGQSGVRIPRFDKAHDDRRPRADWDDSGPAPDLILLEGWCLGVGPQAEAALESPLNPLEREEDADGRWRQHVNRQLAVDYSALNAGVDIWVMLQAPNFALVYRWRREQEEKLRERLPAGARPVGDLRLMSDRELSRFVQFYQRLTEEALRQLPGKVHYLYPLDDQRQIRGLWRPRHFDPAAGLAD